MNENNLLRCRTCYVEGKDFQSLDVHSNNYPQISLRDLLLFLTNIDTRVQHVNSKLPQHVCGVCTYQLESAYLFVRQVQDVNKRYILGSSAEEHQHQQQQCRVDCLSEAPIDIPLDNAWPIKSEKDSELNEVCQPATANESAQSTAMEHIIQQATEAYDYNTELDDFATDPITVELKWDLSEDEDLDDKQVNQKQNSESKRRGRPSKQQKLSKKTQKERFSCEVCDKTFAWRKDVQRHALTHFSKPEHECDICGRQFLRKDKLKDHMKVHEKQKILAKTLKQQTNLKSTNKTQKTQRIECKLCNNEFKTMQQLKQHLLEHEQVQTLNELQEDNEVLQILAKQHGQDLNTLKQVISTDIKNSRLLTYYSITNEFGYEMSLSDTDVDESVNRDLQASKYTCELCQANFSRKCEVFEHVQQTHAHEALPYKCETCQQQFVTQILLQQHLNKQCNNNDKVHHCLQCNVKFMWFENFQLHTCKQQCLRRRVCCLCDQKLNSLVSLRLHLQQHASGELPLEISKSQYLQHNQANLKEQTETEIIDYVKNELQNKNKLWRFYNATDKSGREMDLSDSESDASNAASTTINNYSCAVCAFRPEVPRRKYLLQHQLAEHVDALPFSCHSCEAQFVATELLQQHVKRICDKRNENLTTCPHCGALFVWPMNLQAHVQQCFADIQLKNNANNGHCKNSEKLQCEDCGKVFIWAKDLTRHKRIHLPDNEKYQCPYCERKFVRKDNMQAHLKVHGAQSEQTIVKQNAKKDSQMQLTETKPKFECKPCGRSFLLLRDLTRHSVMHNRDAAIHKCLWCARKFYRLENLQMHIRRHDITAKQWEAARSLVEFTSRPYGVKQFHCKLCNATEFRNIASLRLHLQQELLSKGMDDTLDWSAHYAIVNSLGYELDINDSETDEEGDAISRPHYFCEICNISCRRRHEVMTHQLALHKWEKLPHKCEHCVFRTVCKEVLAHHMRTQCYNSVKQYSCNLCDYRFMWPENLKQHKLKIHVDQNMEATTDSNNLLMKTSKNNADKLFECNDCGEKFSRQERLTMHFVKKHGEQAKKKDEKKFLCAFCGRALSSSSNLIIHMRRHTGEKPFKCEFCDKAFPRSSDMMCHRRTHTGERPHKCTVCNKAFSRSYKLQTHMRIHSGERPYKCTFCEKSFTQSNDLVLHIRRHTGERPYVCGICDERFIQSTALRNHRTMRGHYENNEPRRGNFLEKFDLVP